jgi:hypothetical protein
MNRILVGEMAGADEDFGVYVGEILLQNYSNNSNHS